MAGEKKHLLHRVIVQEEAISSDSIVVDDLGVNPLSVILVALRPLNATSTLANYARYLDLVGALNRITVLHRGASVFSMSGKDAAALNYFRHGIMPPDINNDDVDNDKRCVVLPILLGRFAYDSMSCFPETKRGELTLEADIDVTDTGYDTFRWSVETVELLGARPSEFERKVSISQTFAATGENDVDLPIGHSIRGLLCFGTTAYAGGAPAPSWGRMSVVADGMQLGFSSTDFEVAHMLSCLSGRQPPRHDKHTHRVDASSASTTEETTGPIEIGSEWVNYAFLDLDPTRDDEFSMNTRAFSSLSVRGDAETADAVRVIPVERVSLG